MPSLRPISVLICVCVNASFCLAQSGSAISWLTDLDAARDVAHREQKLLLVHFYTESCGPCRMLDSTVFNQPSVAKAVQSHYVPVKLNANDFPATAQRFGITRVPTDVVITAEGRVIERVVSPATPMAYIGQMTGIAEQHKRQAGGMQQLPAGPAISPQQLNSAYAGLAVPGDNNSFTAPESEGVNATMPNPYAAQTQKYAESRNGYSAGTQTAEQTDLHGANPQTTPQAALPSVAVTNPYANQPVTPIEPEHPQPNADRYANAATNVAAANEKQAAAAAEIQLPANSPPLGFFGHCPVTMKKENRWQQGDVRHGAYHRGKTYLFASAAYRDEFLKDGDAYAPALSGIDPVLAVDENVVEPGRQEFGIEYDGKFYLFSSEDNLRKFWSKAERYADGVRHAMNSAPTGRTVR